MDDLFSFQQHQYVLHTFFMITISHCSRFSLVRISIKEPEDVDIDVDVDVFLVAENQNTTTAYLAAVQLANLGSICRTMELDTSLGSAIIGLFNADSNSGSLTWYRPLSLPLSLSPSLPLLFLHSLMKLFQTLFIINNSSPFLFLCL
jgi:hypothetical protein